MNGGMIASRGASSVRRYVRGSAGRDVSAATSSSAARMRWSMASRAVAGWGDSWSMLRLLSGCRGPLPHTPPGAKARPRHGLEVAPYRPAAELAGQQADDPLARHD